MQGVLLAGASTGEPKTSSKPTPVAIATKKPRKVKIELGETPALQYNPLSASMHQEINEKVSDFYNSLSEFAAGKGLNPVDVTCYALGGNLKGLRMNPWKCFQRLGGMARSGCEFVGLVKFTIIVK
jgi:hypothetical protein